MTIRQAEEDLRAPTAVIAGYLRKSISVSYLIGLVWAGRLILVAGTIAVGEVRWSEAYLHFERVTVGEFSSHTPAFAGRDQVSLTRGEPRRRDADKVG